MKLTVCLMLNLMVKTIVLYTGWRVVVANANKRVVRELYESCTRVVRELYGWYEGRSKGMPG